MDALQQVETLTDYRPSLAVVDRGHGVGTRALVRSTPRLRKTLQHRSATKPKSDVYDPTDASPAARSKAPSAMPSLPLARLCCTDQRGGAVGERRGRDHASRTYSGRPSSSMRFSTLTAAATSVARRLSVRDRTAPPMTRLNLLMSASTKARQL